MDTGRARDGSSPAVCEPGDTEVYLGLSSRIGANRLG